MLNPAVVFALNLVIGIVPAKLAVALLPSILALPAVGTALAPALLSADGSPPAFQFQET